MAAYTKPQQRKKEETNKLRGERDQIKFIDLGHVSTKPTGGLFKTQHTILFEIFFLVGYVEERLWWPMQSPNIGGKKKAIS